MNIEHARHNMIEQQIRPWAALDQHILDVLNIVKRENFVPAAYQNLAFADLEISLPCAQHMLSPKVETRILQALTIHSHESALEIGAGSGYMAALLAHRAHHVLTIEIHAELAEYARQNLQANDVSNVEVVRGDGAQGGPQHAPYDVIAVSGGMPLLPPALLAQLKIGGRLCAFVGSAPLMNAQRVTRINESEYRTENLFETWVTPLVNAINTPRFKF